MMVVLDTDFVIDIMRAEPAAVTRFRQLVESPAPVAVSAMTVMQLHHGVGRSRVPRDEAARVEAALLGLTTYPMTHEVAARAGQLEGALARRGVVIGLADVVIGVTAVTRGEPLVTRNLRHFERIDGLSVETY